MSVIYVGITNVVSSMAYYIDMYLASIEKQQKIRKLLNGDVILLARVYSFSYDAFANS